MSHARVALALVVSLNFAACSSPASEPAAPGTPVVPAAPTTPASPASPVPHTTGIARPIALVETELAGSNLPGLAIIAPAGAQQNAARSAPTLQLADINYSLAIRPVAAEWNVAGVKAVYLLLDAAGTVVVDEPALVIFQRSNGGMLFQTVIVVGDARYSCGTVSTATPFTRAQIDRMVTSCRTLHSVAGVVAPVPPG